MGKNIQIVQISDFHISEKMNIDNATNIIDVLFNEITADIIDDKNYVICINGDIFDKGNKNSEVLCKIDKILSYIKSKSPSNDLLIIPGNHDNCSDNFAAFDKIVSKFNCEKIEYRKGSVYSKMINGFNFILCNTANISKDYGSINVDDIKDKLDKNCPNIILMHHTVFNENPNDSSALRDAYSLFNILNNNVVAILHGHTHGYKDIVIENSCKVIGVGPFLKDVIDINKQANLITISGNSVSEIVNYRFMGDTQKCQKKIVYTRDTFMYKNTSIISAYDELLVDIKNFNNIYHLLIKISSSYNDFKDEIENNFTGQMPIAKDWQQVVTPSTLYYNHGSYMSANGKDHAISYVIEQLQNKATSSRAIIPLINFKDVYSSGDDFLPSFDIVQFGFKNEAKEKLYVSLYMRALEINHFLKINLCELLLLIKQIKEEIRSVQHIELLVYAFKAQYKENYGCFQKATLDTQSSADFALFLSQHKYSHILDLLNQKKKLSETVIISTGFEELQQAVHSLKEHSCADYTEIDLDQWEKYIKDILNMQGQLKLERKKTSNYKELITMEEEFEKEFENFINYVEACDNDNK